ncbi:MAG: hypothetical protein JWR10_1956 [Rubritepida sp.]|nr:hypothetical protein [Rubritepida sp.]
MTGLPASRITRIENILKRRGPAGLNDDDWFLANTSGMFASEIIRRGLAPLPPTEMVGSGGADTSLRMYAYSGAGHYQSIQRRLSELGYGRGHLNDILEFGCGNGRLARMFLREKGSYTGVDLVKPGLVWLRKNLRFGRYQLGTELPPLKQRAERFDAVISVSVLTHLTEMAQSAWLTEFARLLKPGGLLVQTVSGRHSMALCKRHENWRAALSVPEGAFEPLAAGFDEKGFAWAPHAGTAGMISKHYGISFQNEQFIQDNWCKDFELLGIWAGAIDNWQDLVILRRRDSKLNERRAVPILPVYAAANAPPVEAVELKLEPAIPTLGEPFRMEAVAQGHDVHFRYVINEIEGYYNYISEWSRSPSLNFTCWVPGRYNIIVHAASGPGSHSDPSIGAGVIVTV